MEHNVLTGTTSARLNKLILKDSQGTFQNILTLIASGAAGVDLSAYSTTAQVQSLISSSLQPYSTSAQVQASIDNTVATELATALAPYLTLTSCGI